MQNFGGTNKEHYDIFDVATCTCLSPFKARKLVLNRNANLAERTIFFHRTVEEHKRPFRKYCQNGIKVQ